MDVKEAIEDLEEMKSIEYRPEHKTEVINVVLSELEKKDKIIDEMAKYMAGGNRYMYGTPEGIKEDFAKKCEGK